MAQSSVNGTRQIQPGSIDKTRVDSGIIRADGNNAFTANQSLGGFKFTNAANGVAPTDLATVGQVTAGGDVPTPEFPIVDAKTTTSLAAGTNAHLDSVIVPNLKVGKVSQITLSSSAACKWEIKKQTAGVDTALDIVFTSGFSGNAPTHEWEPPHRDYAELTGNGATTFFRVTVTNLDARNPANAYVTFMFDEVDA